MGAFDLLRDQVLVEQLREDIADLLAHPLAEQILTDSDRGELRGTVSLIRQGMSRVIAERARATSALREFIITHDLTRDRELDSTLRAIESEMTRWMQSAGPKSKVPVSLLPPEIDVAVLRERFHDANVTAPPPPLIDVSDHQPGKLSMRDLMMQGGPSLEALRSWLKHLGTPGGPMSAGVLFGELPDELRRPVEIFGVLHLATNANDLDVTADVESYETLRPDGSRRSLTVPRIVSAVDEGAEGTGTADDAPARVVTATYTGSDTDEAGAGVRARQGDELGRT
jgi:hypothetical protein